MPAKSAATFPLSVSPFTGSAPAVMNECEPELPAEGTPAHGTAKLPRTQPVSASEAGPIAAALVSTGDPVCSAIAFVPSAPMSTDVTVGIETPAPVAPFLTTLRGAPSVF